MSVGTCVAKESYDKLLVACAFTKDEAVRTVAELAAVVFAGTLLLSPGHGERLHSQCRVPKGPCLKTLKLKAK